MKHLVDAMRASFLGLPFHWSDILVMAIWRIGGRHGRRADLQVGAEPLSGRRNAC